MLGSILMFRMFCLLDRVWIAEKILQGLKACKSSSGGEQSARDLEGNLDQSRQLGAVIACCSWFQVLTSSRQRSFTVVQGYIMYVILFTKVVCFTNLKCRLWLITASLQPVSCISYSQFPASHAASFLHLIQPASCISYSQLPASHTASFLHLIQPVSCISYNQFPASHTASFLHLYIQFPSLSLSLNIVIDKLLVPVMNCFHWQTASSSHELLSLTNC